MLPSPGLNGLLLSVELNIPEGPEYERINTTLYQCKGGEFKSIQGQQV